MKNLKLLRVTSEFTQAKVSVETGIDQSTLSKYERDEFMPTSENLIILAQFYQTSTDFLLDLTDIREPYPPKKQ